MVERRPLPRDGDHRSRTRSTLSTGRSPCSKAVTHVRAQCDQLKKVSTVQRQVDDPFVLDNRADRRVLRREHGGIARDLHNFRDLTESESDINASGLLYLQFDVTARRCSKALLSLHAVHTVPEEVKGSCTRRIRSSRLFG